MATSSIPAGAPYIQLMSTAAVLELPVSSTSIQSIIDLDAHLYGVSPQLISGIVKRESNFNQYAVGDHGTSFGLVQIHAPAHADISLEEMYNPLFSIDFLARNLVPYTSAKGVYHPHGNCAMWSTCSAAVAALSPPSPRPVAIIIQDL